jgi:hypothetical protein
MGSEDEIVRKMRKYAYMAIRNAICYLRQVFFNRM